MGGGAAAGETKEGKLRFWRSFFIRDIEHSSKVKQGLLSLIQSVED